MRISSLFNNDLLNISLQLVYRLRAEIFYREYFVGHCTISWEVGYYMAFSLEKIPGSLSDIKAWV